MIQSLLPNHKHFINNCQNAVSFATVSSMLALYFVNRIEPCYYILFSYLSVDILFAEFESTLHHTFSLLILSCKPTFNFSQAETNIITKPFVKTEISTVFLIFKVFYENNASESIKQNRIANTLYKINDLLFITTFAKTRMWDLLFDAMLNVEIHKNAINKSDGSILTNVQMYLGFCGLYVMNIYWFSLICKKIYKQLIIKTQMAWINTEAIVEQVLPWTMFAAFIPNATIVWKMFHAVNITSIVVIGALGFSSYIYHSKKRDKNGNASIELFFDTGATHVKSLMALIAMGSNRGASSALIHTACFAGYLNTRNPALNMAPALYDALCIICVVGDRIIQIKIGLTVAALITVHKTKPMYELNQILVHLLEIAYVWILANSLPYI